MAFCKWISVIKTEDGLVKCMSYDSNKSKTYNAEYGQSTAEEKQYRLLSYIADNDKTSNEDFLKAVFTHDDDNEVDYTNEKEFFVDGIMCNRENAYSRMMNAQKMSKKPVVNLAYHAVQSFKEGADEMSAKQAHEIGMKLAEELWGDQFIVLVATHLNTSHYHNHFVICSTSPITGKRFNKCDREWRRMTKCSDKLCREYGLHVIENEGNGKSKSKTQVEAALEKKGIPTHKELLQFDIDVAIEQASDWNSFLESLKRMGYKIKYNNKSISVIAEGWGRAIRIYYSAENTGSLGSNYTKENILKRIEESVQKREAEQSKENRQDKQYIYKVESDTEDCEKVKEQEQKTTPKPRGTFSDNPKDFTVDLNAPLPTMPKYKFKGKINEVVPTGAAGLKITYYRLSYKMCIIPKPYKKNQKKRMSLYMRSELNKLHRYIDEVAFLADTGIKTMAQLNNYKDFAVSQMTELEGERQMLRNKLRRCTNEPLTRNIRAEISNLTSQISVLRKRINMCNHISENTENIRYKVNEDSRIEEQQLRKNENNKTKYKSERKYEL